MTEHYRRHAPDWADTPDESAYWTAEINRANDEAEDQRREAMQDAAIPGPRVEACDCGGRACLLCAFRRVFGGAS